MPSLPTGTVTFLFTDIEGSTRLLQQLGDRYAEVLAAHHRLLRSAIQDAHGHEMDAQGDALFVAFPRAKDALLAAVAAQRAIRVHSWPDGIILRVRMGLHTGEPLSGETGYVGMDVHRAARIAAAGHGGQILLSETIHALVAKDLPEGVELRDLGEHRLKDLAHPHRLFQVVSVDLPAGFPPLKSLNVLPNNLPRQLTSFVGREKEMAEVKRLLATAYLVTLTGIGGAGKTRLAIQVAADLLDLYLDGVWVVELAALSDPALVLKAAGSVLNVPEQPGRPLTETLVDSLRSKSLLLVLDNCEHLLSACAELTDRLLRVCPAIRVLATSREPLGVPGEAIWPVPSMSFPDPSLRAPERLMGYEAVRLFAERAVLNQAGFAVSGDNAAAVVQVCNRLDGIPLAIELAAARVKILTVEQIAARLDDRFRLLTEGGRTVLPRHQTLRAAMDWSYDLLSDQERTVLRRLSAFAGGWTLEAAEVICSGSSGVDATDILNLLGRLVDKSLVTVEMQGREARYRLLETVRQYALEQLSEAGEVADVRTRHRGWCLRLAQRADPELRGPNQKVWLERLETEYDNLRAALEWGKADIPGAEAWLRLAGELYWFWYLRGHWVEGRKWLEAALARSKDVEPAALLTALKGAAILARDQGDHAHGDAFGETGLALSRELGDKEGVAWFLLHLGISARRQGDRTRGIALTEESLALCVKSGDKWLSIIALAHLGNDARDHAEYRRAATLLNKSLCLSREVGDKYVIAMSLRNLGYLALTQGDYRHAATLHKESLTLCRVVGPMWLTQVCLADLAVVACTDGNYDQAARLFGAADASREFLERDPSIWDETVHGKWMAAARARLGDSAFEAAWAEGQAMTLEQAIEYALAAEPG